MQIDDCRFPPAICSATANGTCSSLTLPLSNCVNDTSMLVEVKSEMAVFECSGVCGRILQLVYSYLQ